MATKKLEVVIAGDASGAKKAFGDLESAGSASWDKLVEVGRLAAIATVAAVGVIAVKGVQSFLDFERGMNEVFTLMPGISKEAMDKMTGQVKDFAVEFGVLPEKVVPALYQAISAGVPKDNVFDFLETAQKAARGGVTELTTAVDGISSVVNAYGTEVINAQTASDIMFTAVRLGKTTFEELSTSLFNVNPTAAALGVSFGDVAAAVATMTAAGVPTAVATTQLRQMFIELSKAGGTTAETFEKVSGQTFTDFIKSGGNVQDALKLLETHASDTGVGVGDLFGGVEAGQAAMALTGPGTEKFATAIGEMGSSAGATDEAFDTMNQGLGPLIDKFKAWAQVILIEVGKKIVPVIENLIKWFGDNKDVVIVLAAVMGGVLLVAIGAYIVSMVAAIATTVAAAGGVAAYAGAMIAAAAATWSAAAPILAVVAVVALLVAGFVWAYQNVDWFRGAIDTAWQAIQMAAQWAWDNVIKPVFDAIASFIHDTLIPAWEDFRAGVEDVWPKIANAASQAWENVIKPIFEMIGYYITELLIPFYQTLWAAVQIAWDVIQNVSKFAWDNVLQPIFTAIAEFINKVVIPAFQFLAPIVADVFGKVGGAISWAWQNVIKPAFHGMQDVIAELKEAFGTIADVVRTVFGNIAGPIKAALQAVKDAWNSTVGGKGIKIDSYGPFGGVDLTIPRLHTGGTFRAPTPGGEGLAMLLDGERVLSPAESASYNSNSSSPTFIIYQLPGESTDSLVDRLLREIKSGGQLPAWTVAGVAS